MIENPGSHEIRQNLKKFYVKNIYKGYLLTKRIDQGVIIGVNGKGTHIILK